MLGALKTLVQAVASPIAGAYQSKQERKKSFETAQAKIQLAKQGNDYKLNLTAAEWEAQSKKVENETWKDEYITIVITSPFVLLFVASILSGWTGDMRYLNAVNLGIENLQKLNIDLGKLMTWVVLAALSIKGYGVWKK